MIRVEVRGERLAWHAASQGSWWRRGRAPGCQSPSCTGVMYVRAHGMCLRLLSIRSAAHREMIVRLNRLPEWVSQDREDWPAAAPAQALPPRPRIARNALSRAPGPRPSPQQPGTRATQRDPWRRGLPSPQSPPSGCLEVAAGLVQLRPENRLGPPGRGRARPPCTQVHFCHRCAPQSPPDTWTPLYNLQTVHRNETRYKMSLHA